MKKSKKGKRKTVFLTCGTRGAGKSTYCEAMARENPKLILLSRDNILVELFRSTELNPYEGGHYYAYRVLWEKVECCLAEVGDVQIILDCWNGFPKERKAILKRLRDAGANRVVVWRFITPLETVIGWFNNKAEDEFNSKESNERRSRYDYALFEKMSANIESEGFDDVLYINPAHKNI